MNKGPQVPAAVAMSLICLIIGGIIGFYVNYFVYRPQEDIAAAAQGQRGMPPGAVPGGGGAPGGFGGGGAPGGFGGGRGGGFGGGGGFGPSPTRDLSSLVRNLNTIETVQGKALTHDQAAKLTPILQKLASAGTISDDDAKKQTDAINAILTSDQQTALTSLNPFGGRRGGGGFGGGRPGGGGGGFGGGGNPNQPFANGRNKDALTSLIAATSKA